MPLKALALGIALAVTGLAIGARPTSLPDLFILGVAALLLEIRAVPLSGFGYFSLAFPMYLAAALEPEVGVRAAVVMALAGLLLRGVVRPGDDFEDTVQQSMADGLPVLAGLAAPAVLVDLNLMGGLEGPWVRLLVALVFFLPMTFLAPMRLSDTDPEVDQEKLTAMRFGVFPFQAGSALLAPLIVGALESHPAKALAFVPILLAGTRFGDRVSDELAEITRKILERRKSEAERQAAELDEKLTQTRQDLRQKVEERVVLEELVREFATSPGLDATLDLAIKIINREVRCRSVVFFIYSEERLLPRRWSSPEAESLENILLHDTREPVVDECWQSRRLLLAQERHQTASRLFPKEKVGVALPLPRLGVLYAGRETNEPFRRKELHLLAAVADQTIPAALSAARQEALSRALASVSEANQSLVRWNQRNTALLQGAAQLSSTLESQKILKGLENLARQVVPNHQMGAIVRPSTEFLSSWPGELKAAAGLPPLVGSVLSNNKPLIFDDMTQSRFGAPFDGVRSLLALPLTIEDEPFGVLFLGNSSPGVFVREDQDVLMMAAYHATSVLQSSRLFEQVKTAHRRLEESQAQLVQSSKMAAVGQLAAGVAHEINSPLAAILLAVQSVRLSIERGKLASADKKLSRAEEAAKGAREIISKLMIYSRQAPKGVTDLLDPVEVVRDTLALIGPQILKDNVKVTEELHQTGPIRGNRTELQQVLTNLLLNARDASTANGAEGVVSVRTLQQNGKVLLQVADNGPGVPEEHRDRIFDPFYTTKDVGRGTGLGLSVSLELVEGHDGQISFESVDGKGTVFTVELPLAPG